MFSLLLNIKLGNDINYKKYDSNFYSHSFKSETAIGFDKVYLWSIYTDETDEDKKRLISDQYKELENEENNIHELNNNKNFSLYTSTVNGKFYKPSVLITLEKTTELRDKAIIRFQISEPLIKIALSDIENLTTKMKAFKDDIQLENDESFVKLISSK